VSNLHRFETSSTRSRTSRALPRLETHEDRLVLSVSSPAIHAVTDNFGQSAVFFINQQDHAFYEHDASHGTRQLSGPNSVQSFSAGVDAQGHADVFVKDGTGAFWQHTDAGGWQKLLGPGTVVSFAAVKGDRLYAQFSDNSLHEFDGTRLFFNGIKLAGARPGIRTPIPLPWFSHWTTVPGSGAITALDAVTDTSGQDAVFVKNADKTFGEFYHGSYQQLAGAIHFGFFTLPRVTSFSAGTDRNGNADVYASMLFGGLSKNVGGTWTAVAPAGTFTQFSATDHEQVWFLGTGGSLKKYDANVVLHNVDNGQFLSLSAAASNDVYTVFHDDSLWERKAGFWQELSGPGTVAQ
jgi:hypothetical protein